MSLPILLSGLTLGWIRHLPDPFTNRPDQSPPEHLAAYSRGSSIFWLLHPSADLAFNADHRFSCRRVVR